MLQAGANRGTDMTFRIPRWAVAELDGERSDLHWPVLQPMWHQLRTPYEPDPRLQEATPGQRALYALYWLASETSNGGLHQYFWNPAGMLADEAIQGARRLGLNQYADVLAEAIATVFDGVGVPQDQQARQRALDELAADRYRHLDALDHRLSGLLVDQPLAAALDQYVHDHPSEFFLDEQEEDPAEGAQARLNLAYRLVSRNQPGDLDRARPLLEQAQAMGRAQGLVGIDGRCRSLLDQLDTLRLS
jgi:Domain of unknown function (DUF4375)